MKKIYLTFIAFIIFMVSSAQQIPNGSFEQWAYNSTTLSYEPVGWTTNNIGFYKDSGCYRYKTPKSGNLALGMKTNFVGNTYLKPAFSSALFAFTGKPTNMIGYIKGELALDDTIAIIVQLTNKNKEVASGLYYTYQSQNNYIKFVNPLTYINAQTPDTCKIIIFSLSRERDDTMTNMAIDDLSFEYPANIHSSASISQHLKVYPNPATDFLNIESSLEYSKAEITTSIGSTQSITIDHNKIDISTLSKGVYYLKLSNSNGEIVGYHLFVKG